MSILPAVSYSAPTQKSLPAYNPLVIHDPHAHKTSCERWSKLWTVATLVTAVALISLAAGAIIYASLYLEAHLPIITLTTLFAIAPSAHVVKLPWDKACLYQEEAKIDRKLIQHMNVLDTETLASKLKSFSITSTATPEALRSIMARFYALQDTEKSYLEKASSQNLNADATKAIALRIKNQSIKVAPANCTCEKINTDNETQMAILTALLAQRSYQQRLLQEAAWERIKAAYTLKLTENPYETRELTSFGTFKFIPHMYQLIARESGDKSAMKVFVSAKGKSYDINAILSTPVQQLAKEIFDLKTAPFLGLF